MPTSRALLAPGSIALLTVLMTAVLSMLISFPSSAAALQDWSEISLPDDWKPSPPDNDSVYRCWVTIPASWQQRRIDIFVECGDDARRVLINGHPVTELGSFPPQYQSGLGNSGRYEVDHDFIKFDKPNLVELQLYRRRGRTNLNIAAPAIFAEQFAIHLKGNWQKQLGKQLSGPDEAAIDSLTFATIEDASAVTPRLQRLQGDQGPLSPTEALKKLKTDDAFEVQLVLSDPIIGQPLSIKWDHRGRLWVAEYRQYPDPAGLKKISRDPFLRTVYDRVPPAPPNHIRGKDRISIHEDSNGDGSLDKHSVFLDGLSLMTSFAIGRGGVFVLNPPYLLFYPDADGDDQPDGAPEVLLEGFGIEDSHSIANSLRWGPDGWLYAAQGSTVSGKIRAPGSQPETIDSLGQLIWRYHPETRRYEIFAEGGGNAFGVEIDSRGRIYSGHNGGDTRGFHYVQGGYFQKGFSKHGALSNPYAFGYFPWMKHHSVPRFTHTFVIDEGNTLAPPMAGRLFGVEPLQGRVVMAELAPDGSTYQSKDLGYALKSDDTWFRPVDIQMGPDGLIYVADFYEQRIDHSSHYQGRVSPESGRIYRLNVHDKPRTSALPGQTAQAWLQSLQHPNKWVRHEAIRLIRDNRPSELLAPLKQLYALDSRYALEALWALDGLGELNDQLWLQGIQHPQPTVRSWAIRLSCDSPSRSSAVTQAIIQQASIEEDLQVRSQMASSAKRLPAIANLNLVRTLAARDLDASDPHIPLLLWWSIESVADSQAPAIIELVRQTDFSDSEIARNHLLPRIMKRYAITGQARSLAICGRLLSAATHEESVERLLTGFDEAIAGRTLADLPENLVQELAKHRGDSLEIQLLLGKEPAFEQALEKIHNQQMAEGERVQLIELVSSHRRKADEKEWRRLIGSKTPAPVRMAAFAALMPSESPQVADDVIQAWQELTGDERFAAQTLMASREIWSNALVRAIAEGNISIDQIDPQTVRRMQYHRNQSLTSSLKELWPELINDDQRLPSEVVDQWSKRIVSGLGNPYDGRTMFREKCGNCHRLFGQGGDLGPDLTSYQRTDLRRFLANILDPSLEIREGFETTVVETDDGLVVTGFIESQDEQLLSIRQVDGQLIRIAKEGIVDQFVSKNSLMPSDLLKELEEQQLRDLFAYLRSSQPLP